MEYQFQTEKQYCKSTIEHDILKFRIDDSITQIH